MNPSPTLQNIKYVGLDVHAETIAVAIADSSGSVRPYGSVPAHSHSVDRLIKKLAEDGTEVRYVYEAGPTGFWLCRHLSGPGIHCEVISIPALPEIRQPHLARSPRMTRHFVLPSGKQGSPATASTSTRNTQSPQSVTSTDLTPLPPALPLPPSPGLVQPRA